MTLYWLSILCAYVCGSIPFGFLFVKAAGNGDVRAIGSGNIGATNVLRTGSKKMAIATLICDALKGFIPVMIAHHFMELSLETTATIGIVAILGHLYPVWLRFKGGKGVATTAGVLLAINPLLASILIAIWLIVATVSKISSLAAIITFTLSPLVTWGLGRNDLFIFISMISVLLLYSHRENIMRLAKGEEKKIPTKHPKN